MKSYQGWQKLSFNQKATLTITVASVMVGTIIGSVSAAASWFGYVESKKERIKAEEAMKETQKLTEKNKQLAIATVKAIDSGLAHVIADENYDEARYARTKEDLLKRAGASPSEIDRILGRTNAASAP